MAMPAEGGVEHEEHVVLGVYDLLPEVPRVHLLTYVALQGGNHKGHAMLPRLLPQVLQHLVVGVHATLCPVAVETAGSLRLTLRDRPRGHGVADAGEAPVVQGVVWEVVGLDVVPDLLVGPVHQRVHLEAPIVPLHHGQLLALAALRPPPAGDPCLRLQIVKGMRRGLYLAQVRIPAVVAGPEVGPVLLVKLPLLPCTEAVRAVDLQLHVGKSSGDVLHEGVGLGKQVQRVDHGHGHLPEEAQGRRPVEQDHGRRAEAA
mmetsp:Transcript_46605/g.125151  ORF Transcript_46605/g.125151 Transcript_46605/m.125151 type:complete len:259 (-) Transcript_46605:2-778(-)